MASLAVHAWLNDVMTPSIAFKSLAVGPNLKYSLSALPSTIMESLDARINIEQIQCRQDNQEMESCAAAGQGLTCAGVDVAWYGRVKIYLDYTISVLGLQVVSLIQFKITRARTKVHCLQYF